MASVKKKQDATRRSQRIALAVAMAEKVQSRRRDQAHSAHRLHRSASNIGNGTGILNVGIVAWVGGDGNYLLRERAYHLTKAEKR